jgi:type III secretion system PrgH/EprH family protein
MQAHYIIKILSGTMRGVEFSLFPGDSIFYLGPGSELTEGKVAETIARADNTFFIPDDTVTGSFTIRIVEPDKDAGFAAEPRIEVDERIEGQDARHFRLIPCNVVETSARTFFAVRPAKATWSADVLGFEPTSDHSMAAVDVPRVRRPRLRATRYAIVLATLLIGGGFVAYRYQAPDMKVRGLAAALHGAPEDYDIVYGRDDKLYVFSESAQGTEWARRASERMERSGTDRFVSKRTEADRIGTLLTKAHIDYVVIRLDSPAEPVVLLSAEPGQKNPMTTQVNNLLLGALPYAREIKIDTVSDRKLLHLAQSGLRAQGISVRQDGSWPRVNLANDVFLDDASLNAMKLFITDFYRQWGSRRINISIRLWDDLLKDRSYQYDSRQMLSVGRRSWDFSTQSN